MKGTKRLCSGINCPHKEKCDHEENTCIENLKPFLVYKTTSEPQSDTHSDTLLKIMNKCIQSGAAQRTVGHYVIRSGELSRMMAGEEFHILSNEYMNYDYTPVSSLAIALNTQKGVHYYYYGTQEQESIITSLKEKVKSYYRKELTAKDEIVRWIRRAKSNLYSYSDFLKNLCGSSIGKIIRSIVVRSNIAETDKSKTIDAFLSNIEKSGKNSEYEMPATAKLKNVLAWIAGIENNPDEEDIYKFIDEIGILICPFKDNKNLLRDVFIKDFYDKIQLLLDMKEFTLWQTKSDYTLNSDRINYLLEVFQYKDNNSMGDEFNELITRPMREWLKADSNVTDCEDSGRKSINESWEDNIHFCVVNDENPYTLCYSFALFLGEKGQAASWYTTYKENINRDDSALDNQLLMVDISQENPLLKEIEKAFKTIIVSGDMVKNTLIEANSRIINLLGIE